jgi:hypothetical protein
LELGVFSCSGLAVKVIAKKCKGTQMVEVLEAKDKLALKRIFLDI